MDEVQRKQGNAQVKVRMILIRERVTCVRSSIHTRVAHKHSDMCGGIDCHIFVSIYFSITRLLNIGLSLINSPNTSFHMYSGKCT